jgi:hypothetical protein
VSTTIPTEGGHLALFAARGGRVGVQVEEQRPLGSTLVQAVLTDDQAIDFARELLRRAFHERAETLEPIFVAISRAIT